MDGKKRSQPRETVYLMEDRDGFLVRVPESSLDAWVRAQERPDGHLSNSEQQVVDRIVSMLYGRRE